ncbi:MAG: lectin-like protein [Myxococcota bacterium]
MTRSAVALLAVLATACGGDDAPVSDIVDVADVSADTASPGDSAPASDDTAIATPAADTFVDTATVDSVDVAPDVPLPPAHEDPFDRGVLHIGLAFEPLARTLLTGDPTQLVSATCAFDGARPVPCHARFAGDEATRRGFDGKASFTIRFDERPFGLAGLDLDAQLDEPSQLRTLVGHLAFRRLGLAAPRATLARLEVDGDDFGIYAAVESLDSPHFLTAAVGADAAATGALFTADHPVDLWPWQVAELALTSGDQALRPALAALADALEAFRIAGLDGAPIGLDKALSDRVDLAAFLPAMAAEVWLGHRDGYPRGTRDYALHVAASGRVTFLPSHLGHGLDADDQADPWWSGGRLLRHCFEDPGCRPMWGKALDATVAKLDEVSFLSEVSALRFLVDAQLADDPRREAALSDIAAAQDALLVVLAERSGWVAANESCTDPADVDHDGDGASACLDDCDDDHADVHPGAPEQCNLRDDDCDGILDDAAECPPCLDVADPIHGGGAVWALCYAPRTWADARAACQARGGDLVTVPDAATQDALRRAALALQWNNWWIGLSDLTSEGTFAWVDGSAFGYSAWNGGEPNDYGGNEDCAHLVPWSGGLWNDLDCSREQPYVCALPAP